MIGQMANVRVHLVHAWHALAWDVWLIEDRPGDAAQLARYENGVFVFDRPINRGGRLPDNPTLRVPEAFFKLIVDAATEKLPADGAMADHLKDAITIRDRLLTMIEQKGRR